MHDPARSERGLTASSACPVPDEVHGYRDTGGEERRDTPCRRVLAAMFGSMREHAGRDRRRKRDCDQERDGISRGHNGTIRPRRSQSSTGAAAGVASTEAWATRPHRF